MQIKINEIFKKCFFFIVIYTIAIIFLGIIFEIYLRINKIHPKNVFNNPQGPLENLNSFTWYIRPNSLLILKSKNEFCDSIWSDSFGHRIEHFSSSKTDSTINKDKKNIILAIGDSFTFGIGASNGKSYIANLQKSFDKKEYGKYILINAGCGGYGIEEEYDYLKLVITKLNPDIVLLNILSNDLRDMYKGKDRIKILNGYKLTKESYKIALSDNFFLKNIYIFPWIYQKYKRIRYIVSIYNLYAENNKQRDKLIIKAMHEIDKIKRLCVNNKTKLILVYIPERDGGKLDKSFSDYLSKEYKDLLINTYPKIVSLSNFQDLYYKKDKHFREEGYKILSEIVFNELYPIIQKWNIVEKNGHFVVYGKQ